MQKTLDMGPIFRDRIHIRCKLKTEFVKSKTNK